MDDDDYDDDDDDDDYDPDPCEHEDYDIDILTGEACCHRCHHYWWVSDGELSREITRQAEAYEAGCVEAAGESWWTQVKRRIGNWATDLMTWKRRQAASVSDDEIPF
jgi:hypothetical protein